MDGNPTAHSWLHIFRILSLYSPTKLQVSGGNIDNEEDMRVLETYKNCLLSKFKNCEKEAAQVRASLEDQLFSELEIRYIDKMPEQPVDEIKDELIYDLCGYLLHTRRSVLQCDDCKNRLLTQLEDLRATFLAAEFTASRTYGGLKFASEEMFMVFKSVEAEIESHFHDKDHIYVTDTYQEVISRISKINVIKLFCDNHTDSLSYLIMKLSRVSSSIKSN